MLAITDSISYNTVVLYIRIMKVRGFWPKNVSVNSELSAPELATVITLGKKVAETKPLYH